MRAAWYERQGTARDVLQVGVIADPSPGPGEVRIRIAASGINPGDIKKRANAFGYGMPYPRVIPHSDGAGTVDAIGDGVSSQSLGERVWCFGAQSYRAFGTAAEYTVVPSSLVMPLPTGVSFEQGACLGIPSITAHRSVHVGGPVEQRWVLVQGAAGAVGVCAVQLARRAGAKVIATVRSAGDEVTARQAGAHHVFLTGPDLVTQIRKLAPDGVSHIVEVAFGANITTDLEVLALGGSIASYATDIPTPGIPFWPLLFKNIRVFFVGSDDVPWDAKAAAARDINEALAGGWTGFNIAARFPLEAIAEAHDAVDARSTRGRVVIVL
jgi:NADPH:quinone reductase